MSTSIGMQVNTNTLKDNSLDKAREIIERIYKYHSAAQKLCEQFEYQLYHQYYSRFVSLVSAFGGAAGGVGIQQLFPNVGWEWAIPAGGVLGTLLSWLQQQIENSTWKKRIVRIDALSETSEVVIDAVLEALIKGNQSQAEIDKLVNTFTAQESSIRLAFHRWVTVSKQESAQALLNDESIAKDARVKLDLLKADHPWLWAESSAPAETSLRGLILRRPPPVEPQLVTGAP